MICPAQNGSKRCFSLVCDVTREWDSPFPDISLDVVTLMFVLSAISPAKMQAVVKNIVKYLKPGGLVMFRDYSRFEVLLFHARGDQGLVCVGEAGGGAEPVGHEAAG